MSARGRGVLAAVAVVIGMVAASTVLGARDSRYPQRLSAERMLYLKSGRVAHVLALGFDSVAADIYWIRTVQHYGGDRIWRPAAGAFELLQPLLDLTTTLDPHFTVAYRFGAFFLSQPPPGGPGQPEQAIALLQKGLKADPTRWQYAHDIGFVYLWHFDDAATLKLAAQWFDRAARMPNAPNWLRPVVTTTMAGADREAARASLRELEASADQVWLRRYAQRTLLQLKAMDDIDQLQALVDRYRDAHHVASVTWADLIREGTLRGFPADPAGTVYALSEDGHVALGVKSPLTPLPAIRANRDANREPNRDPNREQR